MGPDGLPPKYCAQAIDSLILEEILAPSSPGLVFCNDRRHELPKAVQKPKIHNSQTDPNHLFNEAPDPKP